MYQLVFEWILKAVLFTVLAVFLRSFASGKIILSRISAILLILLHSIGVAFFTIFFTNAPRLVFGDETQVFNTASALINNYSEKGYRFVRDNFILIDNSYDKTLIPNPDGNKDDSTHIVITDRKKLSALLRIVNSQNGLVDLVVCDIGFSDPLPGDTLLRREMDTLFAADKLLVAVNDTSDKNPVLRFPQNACGNSREATNDYRFISHTIFRGNYYSLPYKIYCFLSKSQPDTPVLNRMIVERTSGNISLVGINTFLPIFSMTSEAGFSDDVAVNDTTVRAGWNMSNLGYLLTADGKQDLLANLTQRKSAGQKNIILLGTFKGEDDIHKTMYGELHGTTIILNILFDLVNRKHGLGWIRVSGLIVLLFLLTAWIVRPKKASDQREIRSFKQPLLAFFFLEIHFLFVFGFVLALGFNASLLAIYFLAFEILWKYFKK